MKNTGFKFIITIFISLVALNGSAQLNSRLNFDSLSCLLIDGRINNADEGMDETCLVELICDNEVVSTITLKEGKKNFRFVLEKNKYYGIRMSKEGYIAKLLSINTDLVTQTYALYGFEFETGLIKNGAIKAFNEDALDFPVAIIAFDYDKDEFSYNEEYTTYIKKEIHRVRSSQSEVVKRIQAALTTKAIAFASE